MYADVQTKADAVAATKKYGDDDGLGPTAADGLDWPQLKALLLQAVRPVALWLGACHSSFAAMAWSPIIARLPVDYIVGFQNAILPDNAEKVLLKLLDIILRIPRTKSMSTSTSKTST